MIFGPPVNMSYTEYMHGLQRGTLYEMYVISVLLIMAGLVLGQTHAAFFVLVAAGITVLFLPHVLQLRDTLRVSARVKQDWEELCAQGFEPTAAIRGRVKEGGAYLAVDTEAEEVAFVSEQGRRIQGLSGITEVRLKTHVLSQWGHEPRTRFDIVFIPQDDPKGFGLSYPRKREAAKAFNSLRKALDERVTITEQW